MCIYSDWPRSNNCAMVIKSNSRIELNVYSVERVCVYLKMLAAYEHQQDGRLITPCVVVQCIYLNNNNRWPYIYAACAYGNINHNMYVFMHIIN